MLTASYNIWFVLLSVLIAALASYVALDLASRVRSQTRAMLRVWQVGGALVMGTGIWSMHFVGMLAMSLPIALGYSFVKTMLSWVAAVVVSGLALHIATRPCLPSRTLVGGALLMGAGICVMHYLGMSALEMAPGIVWNPWLVAGSVVISCGASAVALWMFFELPTLTGPRARVAQPLAALVMGLAITGMHYTGMAAADFPEGSVCLSADGLSGHGLGGLVVLATMALLAVALVVSAQDARLQAEARQSAEDRMARLSADTANQAKTNFLARMSHELRTPLNAIHGFADLMLLDDASTSPAVRRHRLELIIQSSRHLAALIDDLLDISRIELGAIDVQVVSTEVRAIIRSAAAELAERARQGQVTILLPDDDTPLWAMADPVRVHQMASNLISNAIKYNHLGGTVQIEVGVQAEWVRFSISDTGEGLSDEQLASLFHPFNRLGRSSQTEGAGIGLVITKHLVDSMGGRIDVQSERGRGSKFTVLLRRGQPDLAQRLQPTAADAAVERTDVGGRLLYVEDDEINQLLAQSCLALRPSVELRLAGSGEAGLAMALKERPDLILVDMNLPDIHGLQLAARLRAALGPQCPPLVAYSANAMSIDIDAARAGGFSDYLVKPAPARALLGLIDRYLEGCSVARASL